MLRKAAGILAANRDEFELWLVREGGAVPGKAAFEVELVLAELGEGGGASHPTVLEHPPPSSEPGRESVARRVPLGVVAVITPVELPADPVDALGGTGARVRQRGGAEVGCAHAGIGGILVARSFEEAGLPEACCTCCRATPRQARRSPWTRTSR